MTALTDGTQALTRVDRDDAWQSGQLQREFADVLRDAGSLAETPLRLADVRSLLARHLAGRPTRANFRTGTLTVCTMVPMRSVAHRVVCLLGLDEGVFHDPVCAEATKWWPGDRSPVGGTHAAGDAS